MLENTIKLVKTWERSLDRIQRTHVPVQYNRQLVILEQNGKSLQYHSRFDLVHIMSCDGCRDQNHDFQNDIEFTEADSE